MITTHPSPFQTVLVYRGRRYYLGLCIKQGGNEGGVVKTCDDKVAEGQYLA